jgi:hypothetical protein
MIEVYYTVLSTGIFDPHASKARYEMKVVPVLLHLMCVSVKRIARVYSHSLISA